MLVVAWDPAFKRLPWLLLLIVAGGLEEVVELGVCDCPKDDLLENGLKKPKRRRAAIIKTAAVVTLGQIDLDFPFLTDILSNSFFLEPKYVLKAESMDMNFRYMPKESEIYRISSGD